VKENDVASLRSQLYLNAWSLLIYLTDHLCP
jgi:hypothetical protein